MDTPASLLDNLFRRLEKLGLKYIVGGSFASSLFGIRRSTQDLDIVLDISEFDIDDFVEEFKEDYSLSRPTIEQALDSSEPFASFQLIHYEDLFRLDVFVRRTDDYSDSEFSRAINVEIVPGCPAKVAAPENIVLRKLQWFNMGGQVSDKQWNDIVGVLEVQSGKLDNAYLDHWSLTLGVSTLLDKARSQVVV